MTHRRFVERLLIAIAIVAVALLLWRLRHVLVLAFAAVLVAVIFAALAKLLRKLVPVLPQGIALLLSVLLIFALFFVAGWLFGAEISVQARIISELLPRAWEAVQGYAARWGLGDELEGAVGQFGELHNAASRLGTFAMTVGGALTNLLLVIVAGIYFAVQPNLYRIGVIKLVPANARSLVATAFDDSGRALRLWLAGQLVSMALIGVLTFLGLWLLGVPSALALALLAGLLEFIPYAGPIMSAIPAVLLALTQSPELAAWTVVLYVAIQQIESTLMYPLVQQRAVDIPPALLLFALLAGASLFGAIGIFVAAPLTVVLFVLVKRLYVREALNTKTEMPFEEKN